MMSIETRDDQGYMSLNVLKDTFNNQAKFLKIAHINVENITVHRDSFLTNFNDKLFDVVVVTETFLKPIVPSMSYLIDEYKLIRHDRENKEGGGIAIYIRNHIAHKVIASSETKYCQKPEYVIVELCCNWKLLLCAVYKPPKARLINELYENVEKLIPSYDNVVLIGDFNVDLKTERVFFDKTQLLNFVNNLSLYIIPTDATYHRPDTESMLDLMIINNKSRIVNYGQVHMSGISYHDMIYLELNLKHKVSLNKGSIIIRDFKNIQIDELRNDCLSLNWNDLYNSNSIDDKVSILENNIIRLFNKHVLIRKVSKRRNPCPWMDDRIKTLMKERDVIYKRYVRTKENHIWENYKILRNRVKRVMRDARNEYFSNVLAADKSSKDLWKTLRNHGSGKDKKDSSNPVVDLNSLNEYFCGVNSDIDVNLVDYYKSERNNVHYDSFVFHEVDSDVIYKAIMDMSSNAVGNDGIQIKFVKLIFEEIKLVITHIFNYSIVNSVYPSKWKYSLVLPLVKVKNPSECKHYRPINLLCVLGKALDKIVFMQVYRFLNDNSILYKYQSGYRTSYSTQTALIRVTDDIRSAMDNRKLTILMLLDFTRAFDMVNHKLLLAILESYNFSVSVVKWFSEYLSNRMQKIKTCDGSLSDWRPNNVGVPQGSTLSAMLFSIYINRIGNSVMFSKTMLYADDMQLYIHCNSDNINNHVEMLNADLNVLYKWCNDHGLYLNISKCKPIIIGYTRILKNLNFDNVLSVKINDESLNYETSIVNLGLRIRSDFKWTDQVDYIFRKVYQCIYQFKKMCFRPSIDVKKKLVSTLVFPLFDYACCAMSDLNNYQINKLQRAQNACIRFIFNLEIDEHVTPFYRLLGWLKINERLEYSISSLMYKLVSRKEPEYLYEKYVTMRNVHSRHTRHGDITLQYPIHRTVFYTNSFHVKTIRFMNSFDNDLRQASSEYIFNRKLKNNLLLRYSNHE